LLAFYPVLACRQFGLFRRISMNWGYRFVHCVPVCISPVAVHAWSSIRPWDEASEQRRNEGIEDLHKTAVLCRSNPVIHLFAQLLEDPPNRRGEVPTRVFHLCGDLPIPFTRTDKHARVARIALTSMHRSGAKGSSVDPTRRSLQNAGYRLPRIYLLRTQVHNGSRCLGDRY
jgi:hypothetical protein